MSVNTTKWKEFDKRYGITSYDSELTAKIKISAYYNSLLRKKDPSQEDKLNMTRAKVAMMLLKDREFSSVSNGSSFPVGEINEDGSPSIPHLGNSSLYSLAIDHIMNNDFSSALNVLEKLRDKGYIKANNLLGYLYENDFIDGADRNLAKSFYSKGGEEGQFLLKDYESRRNEVNASYRKTLEAVVSAGKNPVLLENLLAKVDSGNEYDLRMKARFYRSAHDEEQYVHYMDELIALNDLSAMMELADYYLEKNDAPSVTKAQSMANDLRIRREPVADFIMGECYLKKCNTGFSPKKALSYFNKFLDKKGQDGNDERVIKAYRHCAYILANDPKSKSSDLQKSLQFAENVKKFRPADAEISKFINNLELRIKNVRSKEKRQLVEGTISLIIVAVGVVFLLSKAGSIKNNDPLSYDVCNIIKDTSTEAETDYEETEQILVINVDSANIRSGPGTGYDVIANGKNGEGFMATGNLETASGGGEWYEIYLSEDRTATGWVSAKVVSLE